MKKCVVFLFVFFLTNSFSQTVVSPQFSELKGIEDQSANTHLFYRIYTYYEYDPIYQSTNHIYHWDNFAGVDTLFIYVSRYESPGYNFSNWVSDIDFWNRNPSEFIYCGGTTGGPFGEGSAYVTRFDGFNNTFGYFWGSANYVDISPTDDSLLYLGINTDGGFGVLKSINGGRSWDSVLVIYQFLSLNPYYENIYFTEDEERNLFRTTDSGITFNLVDPEFLVDTRFYYDSDSLHIYRKAYNKLIVSDNLGEQFSWQTVFTKSATEPFYFCNDISVSGSIYIADRKNIYLSTNYGNNFNLYKSLDKNIVGIYKKPNSNKLYAATKYKIYEITPDSINIIKSLPIPEETYAWLPLNQGDMWVRHHELVDFLGDSSKWISKSEMVGYKVVDNQVYNQVLVTTIPIDSSTFYETHFSYFRVDSTNGIIYKSFFINDSLFDFESFLMDLIVEVGDTIPYGNGLYLVSEEPFTQFGVSSSKRIFQTVSPTGQQIELVKGFGVVSDSMWEPSDHIGILLGCVIDGIVYGDTTVVSVDDETSNLPTDFSLSQNYPNPFNPITNIQYQIPELSSVILKVYDVLGKEVATLVNEEKPSGSYKVKFDGSDLASGIYFYRLQALPTGRQAGSFVETKKMVLLR